jgi:hypothetical protein
VFYLQEMPAEQKESAYKMRIIGPESEDIVSLEPIKASIRDSDGNVLMFSWRDFVETICTGACCFICGRHPRTTKFNDEHILPNWVLHKFGLHGRNLTLPNGNEHKYGTYTIPCCEECNSEMAKVYESEMSGLFGKGPDALQDYMLANGSLLPFTWMALIFLKAHLKDNKLKRFLDRRKGSEPISADYVWEHMHHLHAVARSFHIGAEIEPKAFGSLFVFPVRNDGTNDAFDMMMFTEEQTLYLRLGGTGMIAVFDDACAAANRVRWIIEKIEGPLSWMQAREMAIHMALANHDLINRPHFWTKVSHDNTVYIGGKTDVVPKFNEFNLSAYGAAMEDAFPILPSIYGYSDEEASKLLKSGKMGFLLDGSGNFIKDHGGNFSPANLGDVQNS